jgi:hypothetical protein
MSIGVWGEAPMQASDFANCMQFSRVTIVGDPDDCIAPCQTVFDFDFCIGVAGRRA